LAIKRRIGLLLLKYLKNLSEEPTVDITTQEKNITYPTDRKLAAKIVRTAVKIARKKGMVLRQSFNRTVPKLLCAQRGRRTKTGELRARNTKQH
jgi:transposase, IS5 family